MWDVVDVALNKKSTPKKAPSYDGLCATCLSFLLLLSMLTGANSGQHVIELLDSTVVDIYKGTQAVIFLINPFSKLSFMYVR